MFGWLRRTGPDALEESKHWFLVCSNCGHKRSYYAIGGIRYKGAGSGKSTRTFCSGCNSKQRVTTQWFDDQDPEDQGKPHGWLRHS